jgi:ATP synthase protein I
VAQRDDELRKALDEQIERRRRFRPAGLVGMLVVGGTVGLLFVAPLLLGAYGGRWLDEHLAGYSVHWTLSLILLGIAVGAYNVYRFLKSLWNDR